MGNSTYECWSCRKRFGTQYSLYHHKQDKHGAGGRSSGSSSNFCSRCNYYFENAAKLRTHIDNGHPHESSFAPGRSPDIHYCYQCGGAFDSGLELKNHISLGHHNRSSVAGRSSTGAHPCVNCGGAFASAQQLKNHIASDHRYVPSSAPRKQNKYPSGNHCEPCDYYFQYNGQLKDHIDLGHPYERSLAPRKHVCKDCDCGFGNLAALRTHRVLCVQEVNLEPTTKGPEPIPKYSNSAETDPRSAMLEHLDSLRITGSRKVTKSNPTSSIVPYGSNDLGFARWRVLSSQDPPYDSDEEPVRSTITHHNPQAMIDLQRSLRPTEGSFPLQYRDNGADPGGPGSGSLVVEQYTPRLNPSIFLPQVARSPAPAKPSGGGSCVDRRICPVCSKKFKKAVRMEMHLASGVHDK